MSYLTLLRRTATSAPWPLIVGAAVAVVTLWPVLAPATSAATGPVAGYGVWQKRCAVDPMDLPPEEYTRIDDVERIEGGRYVEPVALNCVLGSYREAELQRYADDGDPVAKLAIAWREVGEARDACAVLPDVRLTLEDAYSTKRADYVVFGDRKRESRPISRVPEAAVVLAQLEHRCGDEERAGELLTEAERLGFDIDWFSAERPGAG